MFGNSKPFGTASTFGASSFGNTSTPFGQNTNTFGAKPATSNVFGSSSFGVSTPSAPMSSGLFGSTTPASGTGLFGQPSSAFGTQAATSTGGFGFGAASNTGSLFGSAAPSTQSSGGLFGNTSTSAFGTPRPTFGGFGSTATGTGLFGQNTSTGTGLFGSSGGFNTTAPAGTTIKFNPPTGTDTMMKGGVSTSIGTRHQCITCMKEYENKSLEELRVEDYAANRKGGSTTGVMGFGAPAQQSSIFGAPAASTSAFSFGGTTQSKPLFGTTGTTNTFGSGGLFGQPAQTQNAGLFGKPAGFGTPATSAAPVFNFGGTSGTSLFGQNNQQKPLFGQTTGSTGLFGNTATTQSTGFGAGSGFGGFGATNQQATGLFGAKPTGFGTTNTTTTNTFSFGNTNNMSGGGLFGQKPAAPAFGTGTGFGAQSTGFGSFGTTPSTGTSLFGQNKPATSGFGTTGNMFGGGLGTSFGNSSFSMGLGTNTGTGLFGTSTANKAPGFSFGNTGSTGFNFGAGNQNTSSFNFGQTSTMPSSDPNNAAALQQAQQQILALTVNPFGDSPLFRIPIKDSSKETEVLKPTNPSAQKALLNDNQYKVALLPTAKIKPKPWSPVPTGKVLLFDGLEDEEPSLGTAAFLPKKSVKKLVLKNLNNSQSSLTLTSSVSPSQSTRIDVSISLKNPDNQQDKSPSEKSPYVAPLTIDITDNNANNSETRTINVRQNSGFQAREPLSDPVVSKNLRVSFNNSMNDSIAALHTNKPSVTNKTYNVWSETEHENDIENHDSSRENITSPDDETLSSMSKSGHPTGITLTNPSYYTIPSLDSMISMVTSDKKCLVKDFTVGRHGYGKVTFPGVTDVYGLNLDEIVIFGKKEINVYPDDEKKPPIGQGLNRKAKVILENVWPTDKTKHTLIQDPEKISKIGYKEKIERCTSQIGATFIDYIPETGSWMFEVDHFSKYGLEDSDEEMDTSKPPEKKPNGVISKNSGEQTNGKMVPVDTLQNMELKRKPFGSFQAQDQEMEALSSQIMSYPLEFIEDEELMNEIASPTSPILNADIDAERIQGMKASFFHQDMDDDNWGPSLYNVQGDSFTLQRKDAQFHKSLFTSTKLDEITDMSKKQKYLESPDVQTYVRLPTPVAFSELNKVYEKGVQNSLSSLTISESKIPELLSEFPVVKSSSESMALSSKPAPLTLNKIFLKPFKKSVLYDKQHLLYDAGYFMGRSFRVGWAGNGVYAYPHAPEGNTVETYQKFLYDASKTNRVSHHGSSFVITLKELSSYATEISDTKQEKIIVDALELQLKNSASSIEGNAPFFIPKPGVEPVHAHANLFESLLKDSDPFAPEADFIRQCAYVWDLLVSLWGKVKGLDDEQENSSYVTQIARREALSRWLIKTTEQDLLKKIAANSQQNDYLTKIFLYLSGRRIADAVKLAQVNNDFRLSLLLSQAEGNAIVRKLLAKQLDNWRVNGAYEFIKQNRIALYALLAGMLVYEDVNCCKNLHWKQTLSLQLWYQCNPNASVQEAVKEYDESFQGTGPFGKYSFPPYPLYMEDMENSEKSDDIDIVFDTCYHILKLYCDRSYRFDLLLMPETYSTAHLDYRLSWLLHLSLSSIGYNIPTDLASTLHLSFASQLESLNLWHWAIFVLLHYTDEEWRIKQVKEVLLRSVSLEQNEDTMAKEKFLTESLLIPEKWIFEAKAIRANALGKKAEEAWNLLKAEKWSESHAVVIKYLASDAVINEDYDYLVKYLSALSVPERSSTILDWSSGGQVYLDYINMCRVVQEVLSRETSAYDLEKFTPEVESLCRRLSSIPAYSLKDRLSIAEMAKKTATILQSISILQASRTNDSRLLTVLASSIKNLPMPYDYAVSENRFVAHCFLEKITTEV